MKVTFLCVAHFYLLLSVGAPAVAADEKLDAAIPRADPQKYRSVKDAKDWANPYLVARADGVEVVSKGVAKGRKVVAVKDLAKALARLPVKDWPYGKVVAVQEVGIRSGGDEDKIKRNKEAVQAALERLDVAVEWWPGA